MNLIEAFLNATAFAYVAAAILALLNRPALVNIHRIKQGLIFVVAGGAIYLSTKFQVYLPLAILYSLATVTSFIGIQKWRTYWKEDPCEGSDIAQIGMALWDLALATSFFYLSNTL